MAKKKKLLLNYKKFGLISKKLERKFSGLLQANLQKINEKVEEVLEGISSIAEDPPEEEAKIEKPKTKTMKKPPATKRKSTPKKANTRKTKKDSSDI